MKERDKNKEKLTNETQGSNETQWLRAAQVKPLYAHSPVNMLSVLAFSLLLTFILWQVISHTVLIIWLSCNLLITLLRYLLIYKYKHASAESLETGRWGNWFAIGMAFNGIVWGLAGILLFAEGSLPHQVLLVLVMGGMVAGAVGSYSIMLKVFMAFTIPTMTPITILFFAQGSQIHMTLGVMAVIFIMTMAVTARRINTISLSSLRLQFENSNLISFLTAEKERTENLNQNLTVKIAAHKKAEEELRASENRYKDLVFGTSDWVWETDAKGVYTYCSYKIEDILGYTPEEIIGKTPFDLMPKDEAAKISKIFKDIFKNKQPIKELENWNIHKDGHRVCLITNGAPKFDPEGNLIGYWGVDKDITARKRAEEALERFRLLLEMSPDPLVIYDGEGTPTYINRAFEQTYGWSLEELSGKRIDFVPPQEVEKTREHIERTVRGEGVSFETQRLTRDGRALDVQIKTAFFQDTLLQSLSVGIVIHRDITGLKQVEEELKRAKEAAEAANRAKTEFLASMSHEIRTPMNAIIGMADLLRETPLTPEQQQYVQVFSSAGENLLNIINDILDISKVEAGHYDIEDIDFDLIEVAEKTCEVIAIRAHERGLELAYHIMPDVPSQLVGDPVRLRQILMNLIGNAIKFTEKGEVYVEVKRQGSGLKGQSTGDVELLFSVADTGIGIPPEKVGIIFDSFTQADSSTTRRHGGTGLGLTISRRLVELMGGQIWVESNIGEGSVFYFTAKFQVQAGPKRYLQPPPVNMEELKILVVDDNATNRMILREMLSGWGALVTETGDGEHAIAELKHAMDSEGPYKLLLLDCCMPGMDGFQVMKYIKENLNIADTTIMMLTSEHRSDDIARCKKLGIACYLVKPIKRSDLFEAITSTIGKAEMVAEEPETTRPAAFEDLSALQILLVEDSVENRLLIQSYLKKTPYKIGIAENGDIAVKKFKSGKYDLVLMDMQMPVMDGYTATREIRKWEGEKGLKATPILALTAYATKEDEQKSLDAGCTAHLTKPIKKARMLEALNNYSIKD